jgi:hypothetical protein
MAWESEATTICRTERQRKNIHMKYKERMGKKKLIDK